MRRIAQRLIPTLTLSVLALVGCKSKKAQLEDIQLFNGQIRTFSLSSEDKDAKAALERVVFSIRNQEPGLITNPSPLPYAQPLNKVLLNITPFATEGVVTEVAVGTNGTFEEWKKGKVYDLSNGVSDLLIRIRNKEANPRLGDRNQYTYRLHLEKYANDPQTFAWQALSGVTGLPSVSTQLATQLTSGGRTYCYYVSPNGTNGVSSFAGTPTSWTAGSLSGIPSGERLTSVASLASTLYATTSAGRLYRLFGTSWAEVSGVTVTRILGALPQGQYSERLALIAPKTGGYTFATYTPSEGLRTGHDVPPTFPITGGYSFAEGGIDYVGARLYLVGGRASNGTLVTGQWQTTNGTDWGEETTDLQLPASPISESIAQEAGTTRLYRFVTNATGLSIYFSADRGAHWEAGRAVALTGLTASDFASCSVFAFQGSDARKIYLIRTTPAGASTLYEGTIRREEHN